MVSTPLKNISQLGLLFHIVWNIKNVPNHQPDRVYKPTHMSLGYLIYPDLDEKPPVPGGKNLQKIRRKGGYHLRSPSEMDGLRSQKSRKSGSERDPTQVDNFSNSFDAFLLQNWVIPLLNRDLMVELWMGQRNPNHHLIDGKRVNIPLFIGFQPFNHPFGGTGFLPSIGIL